MSPSSQSSRWTSSSSSGKIPLSCQSDRQQPTYDPTPRYSDRYSSQRYSNTSSEPSSGYSSTSSNSTSGRSSHSDKIPLSISRGSSSGDGGRSKTTDARYYKESFLDAPAKQEKKSLSCQSKANDARYYPNSSYYR